jgi:hypothetical protein
VLALPMDMIDHCLSTREDVFRLFKEFLGREPESEAAIQAHLHRPLVDLAIGMAKMPEYRRRLTTWDSRELRLLAKLMPGYDKLTEDWLDRFTEIVRARPFDRCDVIEYLLFICNRGEHPNWPTISEPAASVVIPDSVTIVVPTINSASWIAGIFHFYREAGVDPLFAVDTRSSDGTEKVLADLGARFVTVASSSRRVESLLPAIVASSPTEWLLRLDDDELPSGALLRWLGQVDLDAPVDVHGFPRCQLVLDDKRRLMRSRFLSYGPSAEFDRQWRMFRRDRAVYSDELHSPGLVIQSGSGAPDDALILHFDWIIRSYEERLSKLVRYRGQSEMAAMRARHYGIWEDIPVAWHAFEPVESEKLAAFAQKIEGKANGFETNMSGVDHLQAL